MIVTTDDQHYQNIAAAIRAQSGGNDVYTPAEMAQAIQALPVAHVFGVAWDGGSGTKMTRTDGASGFSDPTPAVGGGSGSSPFDRIMPWAGLVKLERTGGTMVAIPKFWYRWEKNGNALSLQIANRAVDGFFVSPAHADRGDGSGERDVVYVGRYHCANGTCKSETGKAPQTGMTRSAARAAVHALGSDVWQFDYAMRLTIQMLYLVEFADWNSQNCVGYGCGNNVSAEDNGTTDDMQYHTGTTAASRTTYGFTQYRNIEGLWDNVWDWMDGCYNNSSGMNVVLKPGNFSDTENGKLIGVPGSGWITALDVAEQDGVQWPVPLSLSGGDGAHYITDTVDFSGTSPCLRCGSGFNTSLNRGMFCISCSGQTVTSAFIGCRLMELPAAEG